ncbi:MULTISPECIES: hypothetical protein [Erysipelotrichaceae]|uniref:hypothetical protein n=1 Tax=Erysipelotrichaceae TaxID=128827 RepID=UPI000E4B8EE9|nr:hypothetical protein [Absiella sp. AM27-20]RHU03308.1 hypothetical protein DW716_15920 [Absiella sp. AM27-20]
MKHITEVDFEQFLESLVYKRFSEDQLQEEIRNFVGDNEVFIEKSELHWDNCCVNDYVFSCSTEKANERNFTIPFLDFDIYVLPTKGTDNDNNIVYFYN